MGLFVGFVLLNGLLLSLLLVCADVPRWSLLITWGVIG